MDNLILDLELYFIKKYLPVRGTVANSNYLSLEFKQSILHLEFFYSDEATAGFL